MTTLLNCSVVFVSHEYDVLPTTVVICGNSLYVVSLCPIDAKLPPYAVFQYNPVIGQLKAFRV